jgi:pimeloyl-ACP methyl ester carboxylesterase
MRNHGRSPHSDVFSIDAMAADVLEFMDQRGIRAAHLLGHSMGGKIAMKLALSHSDRVEKLVVVDIAPRAYPRLHDELLDALLSTDLATLQSRQEVDDSLARKIPDVRVRQFLMKNLARQESGAFRWKANLGIISKNYETITDEIRSEKPFLHPALFVRGERSHYILDSDIPPINALFPNARVVSLNAGHWIHAELPDPFAELVLQFLVEVA